MKPTKKRGRPPKTTVATPSAAAAPEATAKPIEAQAVNQQDRLVEAITTALRPLIDEIKAHMLVAARLAAADTLRSMEKPETVIKRTLDEGRLAASILATLREV